MKIKVKIILIVFLLFLATPTIVAFFHKEAAISCFFTLNEEEQKILSFETIDLFSEQFTNFQITFLEILQKEKFSLLNDKKTRTIFLQNFSPPPEFA